MQKFSKKGVIFPATLQEAKKFSRWCLENKLRRIYPGIYTGNFSDPLEKIVQTNWMSIVAYLVPKGILSYRTALELKPIAYQEQTIVFITGPYPKTISLPGLIIKVTKGNLADFSEAVLPNLARSNPARMLLENLVSAKKLAGIKTVGEIGVESYLIKEMRLRKEKVLNDIRDQAKIIAQQLGFEREYEKLNKLIGALLASHSVEHLKTSMGQAIAKREPFDPQRLKLFEDFSIYLKRCHFKQRNYSYQKTSFKNISFFESYFSNFIEGTEFLIDEAEDIVFAGKEIYQRHEDSHDILSLFYLTNDLTEIGRISKDATEFISLLQERHAYLMKERPDKNPGSFKRKANKAGNTYFVEPEEVIGTLMQGFDIYKIVEPGLARALFMQFLITEVHPFDDGNGRLSRIMMNAELVDSGLFKIIVPTVLRDNYMNGLRMATRDHFFQKYCKVMDQAQAYTATIDWIDYGAAREKIERDSADKSADEGLPLFNRVLREVELSALGE